MTSPLGAASVTQCSEIGSLCASDSGCPNGMLCATDGSCKNADIVNEERWKNICTTQYNGTIQYAGSATGCILNESFYSASNLPGVSDSFDGVCCGPAAAACDAVSTCTGMGGIWSQNRQSNNTIIQNEYVCSNITAWQCQNSFPVTPSKTEDFDSATGKLRCFLNMTCGTPVGPECAVDRDCGYGSKCIDGTCVGNCDNVQCPTGHTCNSGDGMCRCPYGYDSDGTNCYCADPYCCPAGESINPATRRCEPISCPSGVILGHQCCVSGVGDGNGGTVCCESGQREFIRSHYMCVPSVGNNHHVRDSWYCLGGNVTTENNGMIVRCSGIFVESYSMGGNNSSYHTPVYDNGAAPSAIEIKTLPNGTQCTRPASGGLLVGFQPADLCSGVNIPEGTTIRYSM